MHLTSSTRIDVWCAVLGFTALPLSFSVRPRTGYLVMYQANSENLMSHRPLLPLLHTQQRERGYRHRTYSTESW